MEKDISFLIQKIQSLEEQLKEKEKILLKYRTALGASNERIQKITKDMEETLSLVREAHKRLVPLHLPHIPHFEFSYKFLPAARGVSGDFFDVVQIKNSRKFGVILSCCGSYSMTALLLSSFLKSATRLKDYRTAKDFFASISESLFSALGREETVHLFYGLVDRNDFTLDYCLAGGIFAGFRAFDSKFQVLEPCADSACKSGGGIFESRKISINPKDLLLLCSPGIVQRTNGKEEIFGAERVVKAASGAKSQGVLEIRQNVLFQCRQFGGNIPALRDRTILAIEAKDRILRLKKFQKADSGKS